MNAAPDGSPDQGVLLSNLGQALGLRFERSGESGTLDELIAVRRAAASALHTGPQYGPALSNLGNALRIRYERTGDERALAEALDIHRKAVEVVPTDHPARALMLTNLDRAIELSYERTQQPGLLDEQIRIRRERLAALGHDADRPTELANIAGRRVGVLG